MKVKFAKRTIIFFIGFSVGCNGNEQWEHLGTESLNDEIFIERFYQSYGVHAGGSQKYLVTDSMSFRFSVGTCDDKEFFTMQIDGSALIVDRYSRRNLKNGEVKFIEKKMYELR